MGRPRTTPTPVLVVRVDPNLAAALDAHAKMRGLTRSEASRDLLRRALAVVTTAEEAGFQIGVDRAFRAFRDKIGQALADFVRPVE